MDRRAFEPARVVLGRARTVYIARGLARHGTAQHVCQAMPARLTSTQARPGLGRATQLANYR